MQNITCAPDKNTEKSSTSHLLTYELPTNHARTEGVVRWYRNYY